MSTHSEDIIYIVYISALLSSPPLLPPPSQVFRYDLPSEFRADKSFDPMPEELANIFSQAPMGARSKGTDSGKDRCTCI